MCSLKCCFLLPTSYELNPCWFKIPCARLVSSKPPSLFISVLFLFVIVFFLSLKNIFTHLPLGDMHVYWWRKITHFVLTLELVKVSECIYLNTDWGQFHLPLSFLAFWAACLQPTAMALQRTPHELGALWMFLIFFPNSTLFPSAEAHGIITALTLFTNRAYGLQQFIPNKHHACIFHSGVCLGWVTSLCLRSLIPFRFCM